jgi:hypothetical protein
MSKESRRKEIIARILVTIEEIEFLSRQNPVQTPDLQSLSFVVGNEDGIELFLRGWFVESGPWVHYKLREQFSSF